MKASSLRFLNIEQTLSIIKPDAVERNLENEIKEMFKNNGFSILKEKKIHISKDEAEKFYKVHESKPFYNDLCDYLSSGPIVVMILEKENAVLGNRELMGATNPKDAKFVQYLNTKNADLAPEGMTFVSSKNSPTKNALLIVGFENSGSTSVFEIK